MSYDLFSCSLTERQPAKRRTALGAAVLAGIIGTALAAQTPALSVPAAAGRIVLSGHVSSAARVSRVLGVEPAAAPVSLAVSLPLRNQGELSDLLRRVYDPADPLYKQFLTSQEYTARFGPTQAQYNAVLSFLKANGLTVTTTYPTRTQIDVIGSASRVNAAFGIQLKSYLAADGSTFRAADRSISIPAAMAGSISAVTGLDTSLKATPNYTLLGRADDESESPSALQPVQGTGPSGTFSASDTKTAYNLNSTKLDGTGQTIGLVEFDSNYNQKDTLQYCAINGIKQPRVQNVFVYSGGYSTAVNPNGNSLEIDLDIDMALSLAPKATVLVYMVPFNGGQGPLDELQQIISENRAKSISASYGFGAEDPEGLDPTFDIPLNNLLGQMALQGQSFFISSGDSGSSTSRRKFVKGVDRFGALPNSCTVGGTQLSVVAPQSNENYLSETTWNIDGSVGMGAGGGGISTNWPIPFYQTSSAASADPAAAVSKTMRNIPDVSLNASNATGYTVYTSDAGLPPGFYGIGGTSASAPLWAAFTALVNQNNIRNGNPLLGFANPTLYALGPAGSNAGQYKTVFHDIADFSTNSTSGSKLDTQFVATAGFDDATGLGSFNGINLIQALSGPTP